MASFTESVRALWEKHSQISHGNRVVWLSTELLRSLKVPEDLNQLCVILKKVNIETVLGAELSNYLDYDSGSPHVGSNSYKKILTSIGEL